MIKVNFLQGSNRLGKSSLQRHFLRIKPDRLLKKYFTSASGKQMRFKRESIPNRSQVFFSWANSSLSWRISFSI